MAWSEVSFLKVNAKVIRLLLNIAKNRNGLLKGVNAPLVCAITDYAGRGKGQR